MNEQQTRTMQETMSESALLPAKTAPLNQNDSKGSVIGPRVNASKGGATEQYMATLDENAVEAYIVPIVLTRDAKPQNGPKSLASVHAGYVKSLFPGVK